MHVLEFVDWQVTDVRIKFVKYPIQNFTKSTRLSDETLIAEITPVVPETKEFRMSKEWINDCTLNFWECVDFDFGKKGFDFFLKYYCPEVYLLLGISIVEVKPVVTGKDVVTTEINQNHHDADARIDNNVVAIDSSSEKVGFPNETFLEEYKPVKKEIKRNMFSKIEMSRYKFQFLELLNCLFLKWIAKSIVLKQNALSENMFSIGGWIKEKNLSYGEKQVRWGRSNSNSRSFWKFWWTGFCRIYVFISQN